MAATTKTSDFMFVISTQNDENKKRPSNSQLKSLAEGKEHSDPKMLGSCISFIPLQRVALQGQILSRRPQDSSSPRFRGAKNALLGLVLL